VVRKNRSKIVVSALISNAPHFVNTGTKENDINPPNKEIKGQNFSELSSDFWGISSDTAEILGEEFTVSR
jgi:hypothetical protein